MSQFNTTFSLPALIVKVDINGNVIEAFKGLNYNSTSYIMNVNTMNVLPDSSFLLKPRMNFRLKLLIICSFYPTLILNFKNTKAFYFKYV